MPTQVRQSSHSLFLAIIILFGGTSVTPNVATLTTPSRNDVCSELVPANLLNRPKNWLSLTGSYRVIGNMAEGYFTSSDHNATATAGSWRVSPGCTLTACKNEYLCGSCHEFTSSLFSPQNEWLSAKCTCAKDCSCSNVKIGGSVCARAYRHSNGCNVCNAPYTELDHNDDNFPEELSTKVRSFLVKPGCVLTVYSEENFEGDSESFEGILVENWNGTLSSYECECDESSDEHLQLETTKNVASNLVDIPDSLDDVVAQLREHNFNHQGLLDAFASITKGRSSRRAYILTIGSTGAGKSSCINILLGNPHLAVTGDASSTTQAIHEFHLPVPVPGIRNAALHVIDTPGLGDTDGIGKDAILLATLDDYLSGHEDLKRRIPNVVLVFHRFDDNRYEGEGASFIKMLRGLDTLRGKITDSTFSNVVFVFSHFCSGDERPLQRNPEPKLMRFKEAIQKYSEFPKPILTAVVENKPKENDLVLINGDYELPNKELFPQNLVNKFALITKKSGDSMGHAIFQTVFEDLRKNSRDLSGNITETRFEMLGARHSKTQKYLEVLTSIVLHIPGTDVSRGLTEAYQRMNATLRNQFPGSLEYLQRFLAARRIRSVVDLPQTTSGTLELLHSLPVNQRSPAIAYLLEKGLSLKAPSFSGSLVTGHSYNALKDAILTASPFKLDDSQMSLETGFRLPKSICCTKADPENATKVINVLKIFSTKGQYIRYRIHRLGISLSGVNTSVFTGIISGKIKPGFYVNQGASLVASRLYEQFKCDIDFATAELLPAFKTRVTNIPAFNGSSPQIVKQWADFFEEYGTHVVRSSHVGGRIDIEVSGPLVNLRSLQRKVFHLVEFADNLTTLITGDKIEPSKVLPNGFSQRLTFHGGNLEYHSSDLTQLSLEDASTLMRNWKKSLRSLPVVQPAEVVSITAVVRRLGGGVEEKVEVALNKLFRGTLHHASPPQTPPATSFPVLPSSKPPSSTATVNDLESDLRETENHLKTLQDTKHRLQAEADRDRKAELEEQRRIEKENREKAAKRRKEEAELRRQLQLEHQEQERLRRKQEQENKRAAAQARQRRLKEETEERRRIAAEEREAKKRVRQTLRQQRQQARRGEGGGFGFSLNINIGR